MAEWGTAPVAIYLDPGEHTGICLPYPVVGASMDETRGCRYSWQFAHRHSAFRREVCAQHRALHAEADFDVYVEILTGIILRVMINRVHRACNLHLCLLAELPDLDRQHFTALMHLFGRRYNLACADNNLWRDALYNDVVGRRIPLRFYLLEACFHTIKPGLFGLHQSL